MSKVMLKVTLIGDGAVGKTSLRNRYMGRGFRQDHLMTIGADFATVEKEIIYNERSYNCIFQIWDIAGQKRFSDMRARFFHGSMAAIAVFDITRPDSFQNIPVWIEEIWKNNGKGAIPIVLVGNKSDLRDRKSVPTKTSEDYAKALSEKTQNLGFRIQYVETSAKTGENIDLAFEQIGKHVIENMKR